MKESGLSPSVLTNVFIAGTKNITVLENICGVKIPFPSCTMVTSQENRHFVLMARVFCHGTNSPVGRLHLDHTPRFLPKSVFYTQSIMLSLLLIPESLFYT